VVSEHALGLQMFYPHPQLRPKPLSCFPLQSTHGRFGQRQLGHPFHPGWSIRSRWVENGGAGERKPSLLLGCEQSPRDAARIPLSAKQNEHGRRDKIGCVEEAKTVIGVPHGERAAAFELPVR
jgi:hypothetical protein